MTLPYIGPEDEQSYIRLALERPEMLCAAAPPEILQAASFAGEEPTAFLRDFFAAGYTQWVWQTQGIRIDFDQERIARAVLLLWIRACHLYTSREYNRPDPDWEKPFFSDAGLYD